MKNDKTDIQAPMPGQLFYRPGIPETTFGVDNSPHTSLTVEGASRYGATVLVGRYVLSETMLVSNTNKVIVESRTDR